MIIFMQSARCKAELRTGVNSWNEGWNSKFHANAIIRQLRATRFITYLFNYHQTIEGYSLYYLFI